MAELSKKERHVLEHTTGWRSANPGFRNHFVAGEGHDDWETLQELCRRGLMRVSREPSELSGGDFVFSATEAGKALLGEETVSEECVCARCHRDYALSEECEPSKYCNRCVHDVVEELEAEMADVLYLDDAARRLGTRLNIPAKLPWIDEDHIHFVLMPIGVISRRAAVRWLKAELTEPPCAELLR